VRCFIALPLPPPAREALARGLSPIRGRWPRLRWVAPESYHLTLAFLGETDEAGLDRARRALEAAAGGQGFGFSLSQFSFLPPRGSPRVFVADVEENPAGASADLYRLVTKALDAETRREAQSPARGTDLAGGRPDRGRPYRAHITLARIALGAAAPDRETLARVSPGTGEWTIDRCVLYKSDLQRGGAVYTELASVALI
jgi:2'-5' RNA ligase